METDNSPSQQPVPRQPQPGMRPRSVQPMGHRPMIDGFAPRRPTTPPTNPVRRPAPSTDGMSAPSMQPRPSFATRPGAPTPVPTHTTPAVAHTPAPHPQAPQSTTPLSPTQQPRPFATRPATSPFGNAVAKPAETRPSIRTADSDPDMTPASKARPPKEHNATGHAGLVGLAAFIIFGTLLLSPVVPGHISQSFPLSSSSFSTGQQSLDCLSSEDSINNVTKYTSKAGSPITYTSGTSTTQTADCDGRTQSAVVETTSQFNPLGLLLDLVVALAVAIVIGRAWRLVFGEKSFKPRKHEEIRD